MNDNSFNSWGRWITDIMHPINNILNWTIDILSNQSWTRSAGLPSMTHNLSPLHAKTVFYTVPFLNPKILLHIIVPPESQFRIEGQRMKGMKQIQEGVSFNSWMPWNPKRCVTMADRTHVTITPDMPSQIFSSLTDKRASNPMACCS